MSQTLIGLGALGLLLAWLLGGILLRLCGLALALGGSLGLAVFGNLVGLLVAATGALLWLAGHWHYALRHQEFKSPLARQVFSRWAPAWLDPTRDWAVAVEEHRLRRDERKRR
jgi:hypothetical protein